MLDILYFARLRDDINCSEEKLEWQHQFTTLGDIKTFLSQRNTQWQKAFDHSTLASVNQTMAQDQHPIKDGDEIAFFPPVTGG